MTVLLDVVHCGSLPSRKFVGSDDMVRFRFKLAAALHEAGLSQSEFARDLVARAQPARCVSLLKRRPGLTRSVFNLSLL